MNIIIVGAGEIGRHLAIELSQGLALLGTQGEKLRESYSVTVIDSDPQLVAEMERVIDAKVICADGGTVDPETFRCPDNFATVDLATCTPTPVQGRRRSPHVVARPDVRP